MSPTSQLHAQHTPSMPARFASPSASLECPSHIQSLFRIHVSCTSSAIEGSNMSSLLAPSPVFFLDGSSLLVCLFSRFRCLPVVLPCAPHKHSHDPQRVSNTVHHIGPCTVLNMASTTEVMCLAPVTAIHICSRIKCGPHKTETSTCENGILFVDSEICWLAL